MTHNPDGLDPHAQQNALNSAFQTEVAQRFYQSLTLEDQQALGTEPTVMTSTNLGEGSRLFWIMMQNATYPSESTYREAIVARRDLHSGVIQPEELYAEAFIKDVLHFWRTATASQ